MLAGTPESPGEVTRNDKGQDIKIYRGMASKEAFEAKLQAEGASDRMKRAANYTPEGIQVEIPTKPPVEQLLSQFSGGLRSAMSYTGARNLKEYKEKAKLVRLTNPGLSESDTHIRFQK
jgi:IMP dehydrogenase